MLGRCSTRPAKLRLSRLGHFRLLSGKSVHEIAPSSLDGDNSKVPELIDGRVKNLWPQADMALPASETIFNKFGQFSRRLHHWESNAAHLSETLAERPEKVWEEFSALYRQNEQLLSSFGMIRCTKLMNIVTRESEARLAWGRANLIANAVQKGGKKLSPPMYSILIRAAYRSRKFDKVFQLWQECGQSEFSRTTGVWNSYIAATCGCYNLDYGFNPKSSKYSAEDVLTPIHNDALDLLSQMIAEGLHANARTYELLISSFAFKQDIDSIRTIVTSVWGSPTDNASAPIAKYGSVTHPHVATLTAIVRAFARCGEFQEGVAYADWLRKRFSVNLSNKEAIAFWKNSLNWALWTASPKGNTDPATFDSVWSAAINSFNVNPNRVMLYARLAHLEKNREYDSGRMGNFIELLNVARQSKNLGPYERDKLLKKFVHRIARNLAIRGYDARAIKLVNDLSPHSPKLREFRSHFFTYLDKSWRHNLRRRLLPRSLKTARANAT
uniref:ATPase expression protein 2, mitochondrial n=1 Tax=Blastobotrys adeninivorans TaxID=409370 RepID=A0A060TAA2_BLAAD